MKYFVLLLLLCGNLSYAQNLVPNPGFEDYVECPWYLGNVDIDTSYTSFTTLKDWISPLISTTPDYFNTCSPTKDTHIPDNYFTNHQPTHSGNGYVGLVNFEIGYLDDFKDFDAKFYSEYIECRLTQPLQRGYRYEVSFYVSYSMIEGLAQSYVAVDGMGAHFSDTAVTDIGSLSSLSLPYHTSNVAERYIGDTNKWVKVSGTYIAHGGERWMTIGTFSPETVKRKMVFPEWMLPGIMMSHVFIDDVSVIEAPCDTITASYDTLVCDTVNLLLGRMTKEGADYLWNTGARTKNITAVKPGVYWCQYRIGISCILHIDTFNVRRKIPQAIKLTNVDKVCKRSSYVLGTPVAGAEYIWSTGETVCCISPKVTGRYIRTINDGCTTSSDTAFLKVLECNDCLVVPSAFSPNNDGHNDVFSVKSMCPLTAYTIRIYNRWGQEVFTASDISARWDGTYKGADMQLGDYYYLVYYRAANTPLSVPPVMVKGEVMLVR